MAQQPLRPGEAVVTRFSGTTSTTVPGGSLTVIDPEGTSASIIDLRSPGRPPQGDHWINEPQRNPVTAGQVGQVFGVALDNEPSPNIYLSATSAFGLHRTPDNSQWMQGMWGAGGGPGTIYKLDPAPATSRGRSRTSPSTAGRTAAPRLGNIAYDRWNQQLFVSDMETGMIHRIRSSDGADLGFYDHGVQGRVRLPGCEQQAAAQACRRSRSIPVRRRASPIVRRASSSCRRNAGISRQRPAGVGPRRRPGVGQRRNPACTIRSPAARIWARHRPGTACRRTRSANQVWSIRIGPGRRLRYSSIRREFIMPDFFFNPQDVARAGLSRPVSDISFPLCTDRPIMLLAERGGIRNLGLDDG